MLYQLYQAQADLLGVARAGSAWARALSVACGGLPQARLLSAAAEWFATTAVTHERPAYGLDRVTVQNRTFAVREEAVLRTPFGTLLHFRKDMLAEQPRVLVVAPMSGHFATLLRGTVETLLPDCDVYITDWHNARDVPVEAGVFGLDEFVDHLIRFLETLGPGSHLMAVCQPTVPALIAASVMAVVRNPAQPRSMTLMAGPIDTRISPTKVNRLAKDRPIEWFERNLIGIVPHIDDDPS